MENIRKLIFDICKIKSIYRIEKVYMKMTDSTKITIKPSPNIEIILQDDTKEYEAKTKKRIYELISIFGDPATDMSGKVFDGPKINNHEQYLLELIYGVDITADTYYIDKDDDYGTYKISFGESTETKIKKHKEEIEKLQQKITSYRKFH